MSVLKQYDSAAMTNENLQLLIELMNDQSVKEDKIFTRSLSPIVDFAKVWKEIPQINDKPNPYVLRYEMYFIKNEQGKYVGVVLDMRLDLHWYIHKEHRTKGHLSRALKKTILPFIFYEIRDLQRITISKDAPDYLNSKSTALRAGFKPINDIETEFELSNEDFDWGEESINWSKEGLSTKRNKILQKRISYASNLLRMVSDELEMKIHDDNGLKDAVDNVARLKMWLEDMEWEKQNQGV